jgi:hypothetical protein
VRSGYLKEATRLSGFCRLFLLGTITLFLLTGAAWGQSLTPTPSGPNQPLQSDKEDIKPSPEGQRELPLKDLREQPVKTQEDQVGKTQDEKAGKSLKKPYPDKPKSRVSRGKKPGAGKPASEAYQDPFTPKDAFAPKPESDWWPPQPKPAAPSPFSLEGSLRQDPEKDSPTDEDEDEDEEKEKKREELENLPQDWKKLIKPPVGPKDTEQKED